MSDLSINVADKVWPFSDIDLVARLTDTEDHFTERKSKSDKGGWLRTTVAFANSAPTGYPALLFVGVTDDGTITDNGKIDELMKSYSDTILNNCYPPIYTMPQVFTHSDKSCVVVTVPGSQARPHFAGLSYVRDGTQTRPASEKQYELLITQRQSKAREILQWKGRNVGVLLSVMHEGRVDKYGGLAKVVDCNQFFVTLDRVNGSPFGSEGDIRAWYPLGCVDLSGCSDGLKLEVSRQK
jgi:hypothetical protein